MKKMDIFNIKPFVFYCYFLLLLFKLGFAEYSTKCIYILKTKKNKNSWGLPSGWFPFAVGFCYLVFMVNVPSRLTPQLYSIVAALTLTVVLFHFSCC